MPPVGERDRALLVAQSAVGGDQLGEYILVVNDDNVVERRSVTGGAVVDGMRVIEDGLSGNERVIVKGLQRAIPGREVRPEHADQAIRTSGAAGDPSS